MEIAVCVCPVPDTVSVIGFEDGKIDRSRVNEVMNPYDEYALEEAVKLRERFAESVVTVFCAAPAGAAPVKEILRKALALGADRAVMVSGNAASDPFQSAQLLSRAITLHYGERTPELIFCGKHSTDFQHGEVPGMLAEFLGMASVSAVTSLNATEEALQVEREIEGGVEYLDLRYPALISAEKGLNLPRKPSIRGVMEARKKSLESLEISFEDSPFITMSGIEPLERKKSCHFAEDEKELIRLLSEERSLF